MDNFLKKNIHRIIIISLVLMIVSPFLLTRNIGLISFKDTGSIGDTIGGLTAPIIGLMSALLVYVSFKEQIAANEKIDSNRRKDLAISTLNSWTQTLYSFILSFQYANTHGAVAITMCLDDLKKKINNMHIAMILDNNASFEHIKSNLYPDYYKPIIGIIDYITIALVFIKENNYDFEDYNVTLGQIEYIVKNYLSDINGFQDDIERINEIQGYDLDQLYLKFNLANIYSIIENLKEQKNSHA